MKTCPRCGCGIFKIDKKGHHICQFCKQQRYRRWKKNNPTRVKQLQKKYDLKRRDSHLQAAKKRYSMNAEKEANRLLQLKYGYTLRDKKELLESQQNKCAVCNKLLKLRGAHKERAHLDHNHVTGQIRGILCNKCNTALGFLNDDVHTVFNLWRYIESWTNKSG